MNTTLWIISLIVWLCCGVAGMAHSFAYTQGEFRIIAKEMYRVDRIFSFFVGLMGPIGLFASIVASGFDFKHGWRLRRERT